MADATLQSTALGGTVVPFDFSAWGMFLHADIVGKTVILGLLIVSIWSWAVMIEKAIRIRRVRKLADRFEETFWSGVSADKLNEGDLGTAHPYGVVFAAAMKEWKKSVNTPNKADKASIKQRLHMVMRVAFDREMTELEGRLGFLATVGSVAPFVGLFGTVWGIMRAFSGIAQSQNTSLAVVAPGIAEALFATAIGLVAAIPAVIAYNKLSADVGRFGNQLSSFCDEFMAILSRQLDEKV